MLSNPKPGQPVRIRYAKSYRRLMPYHGMAGIVVIAHRGKGKRNHLINAGGHLVVVPAGNLFKE